MSTLLNEGLVTVNSPTPSQQIFRPIFNDSGTAPALSFATQGYDHFYTLLSHVAHNTSLPSWIDGDYFYFPFTRNLSPGTSGSNQAQQFRGSTLGFGAEASCKHLSPGEGDHQFLFRTSQDGAIITLQLHTSFLMERLFPHRNVCIYQLSVSRDQRRHYSGYAHARPGWVILFGGQKPYSLRHQQLHHQKSQDPTPSSVFAAFKVSQNNFEKLIY
jgi:hypothetical protein